MPYGFGPGGLGDGTVAGGLEGARMVAALVLSLGIHAGVAAWLDLPGGEAAPTLPRSVNVTLVGAMPRGVLAPAPPARSVARAAMPAVQPLSPAAVTAPAAMPAPLQHAALRPLPAAAAHAPATSTETLRTVPLAPVALTPQRPRSAAAPTARVQTRTPPPVARQKTSRPVKSAGPGAHGAPRRVQPLGMAAADTVSSPPGAAPAATRLVAPGAGSKPAEADTPVLQPARPLADNPRPGYPRIARRRGQQGNVLVRLDVGVDGTASSVRVISSSGVASLDEAAREAVSRWRFAPARRGGRAEAATVDVPVEFRLDGRS